MSAPNGTSPESHPLRVDTATSWSVLALLTLSYALANIDRQMLNLLVDPIKGSLRLSDTEFSLVQGSAFVSAYLIATPIFGRLVDVTNRRNLLAINVCIWSICTALCGLATGFWGLFLPRFGVGVSEACVLPVAWSLIGDYFSERRVPKALSIFQIGTQLGSGFSLIASGAVIAFAGVLAANFSSLEKLLPWQMAFVVIGLPGLLLAVVLVAVVREPARQKHLKGEAVDTPPAMRTVMGFMWGRRGFYGRLYLAIGMIAVFQLGVAAWFPSFLIRVHGMPASLTGYRFGILSILCGASGVLLGPIIAQRLMAAGRIDTPLRVAAFATVIMFCGCIAIPFASSGTGALVAAGIAIFFGSMPLALISSVASMATPNRMRGVAGSLYTFTTQSLGYGVGPTAVALITDKVFRDPKMVGFSLQIVAGSAAAVAVFMLFTLVPIHRAALRDAADRAAGRGVT